MQPEHGRPEGGPPRPLGRSPKALVTGGLGFIGSHLVDRLWADGWDVTVIDDASTGNNQPPAGVMLQPHSIEDVFWPLAVDMIFHLASPVGPLGVLKRSGQIANAITHEASIVAHWAVASGARLIDVSTSEVYGDPTGSNSERTVRRFQPGHSARMEYAIGKLAAEIALLNTPRLDVCIVRPFNVAGPRQRIDGGFVLPRFVRQALAGEPLTVYQPGTQRRAFTHVLDIVDGLLAVAQRGKSGEDYNLGNPGNVCTIQQLAEEVILAAGSHSVPEIVNPRKLHGPAFAEAADKVPHIAKVRALGWKPKYKRPRIVLDVVEYERGLAA